MACHDEPTTNLVEIEHQIQLAHIPKELIQHLHEEMYRLEIRQLVVVCVDTHAEEQPRVSAIHHLRAAFELDEIRLVFLVSGCDESVDLYVSDEMVDCDDAVGGYQPRL